VSLQNLGGNLVRAIAAWKNDSEKLKKEVWRLSDEGVPFS